MDVQIIQVKTEKEQKLFVTLPKKLYGRKDCMQSPKEERSLLRGTHCLSHYFQVTAFLALNEKDVPLARGMVTLYPNEETAYVGFFECVQDITVSEKLFEAIHTFVREQGRKAVVGPVNASFWIGYRLKINQFVRPYTGEPYNKDYYYGLFAKAGYHITDHYVSHHFPIVQQVSSNTVFQKRLEEKLEEGYVIKSPSAENFEEALGEIYELIVELYKDFPAYAYISREEFLKQYSYMAQIVDYRMVKIAYYRKKAVAFFVSIPNYNNMVYGKLHLWKLLQILRIRKHPKEYVMLYLGVDREHKGLGKAMTQMIRNELYEMQLPSIGALIHQGKVTESYYKEIMDREYSYELLQHEV